MSKKDCVCNVLAVVMVVRSEDGIRGEITSYCGVFTACYYSWLAILSVKVRFQSGCKISKIPIWDNIWDNIICNAHEGTYTNNGYILQKAAKHTSQLYFFNN